MKLKSLVWGMALATGLAGISNAADVRTFSLEWTGVGVESAASATGTITIDLDIFSTFNTGNTYFNVSAAALGIQDFSITLVGATAGNGTFILADFENFAWDSGTGPLDFTQQLVGQNGWGDPFDEDADFNVFGFGSAPYGVNYFTIAPNGAPGELAPDGLVLTSFAPVPEPSSYAAIAGGIMLGMVALKRRRA